jgi:hypothetical protein
MFNLLVMIVIMLALCVIRSFAYSELAIGMLYMESAGFCLMLYLLLFDTLLGIVLFETLVVYLACIFAVESIVLVAISLRLLQSSVSVELLV